MSYSIMEALFDGRVIPWERRSILTKEYKENLDKFEREKRYFTDKMSLDDCKRFEEMEALFMQIAHGEDVQIYNHGFTLGMMIMMEVLEYKNAIVNE